MQPQKRENRHSCFLFTGDISIIGATRGPQLQSKAVTAATSPGPSLRRTFSGVTAGIFLSFAGRGRRRAAAPPSHPVPNTPSVPEKRPSGRRGSASRGADGDASGGVRLIPGENHAVQGEAASRARAPASVSVDLAVDLLRGGREEGGAEHHGGIWNSLPVQQKPLPSSWIHSSPGSLISSSELCMFLYRWS